MNRQDNDDEPQPLPTSAAHFMFWGLTESSKQNNKHRGKAQAKKNKIIGRKNA